MTEKRFISIGGSLYDTTKAITDGECMGVFIDRSECENVCDLLNEQSEKIKELDKYCTACDDTLLTIQELTYKLLTIDFKDIEMSFIHDCIKSINKCDLLEMEKLKRE